MSTGSLQPDPGSFRDPSSRVIIDGERVLRALDAEARDDFAALESTSFFGRAVEDGSIVGTRLVDLPKEAASDGWVAALEHERVPVISYPYEWTFSMLRDAALLQLDLTQAALDEKLITKDATPYNIQFVGATPTFIDLGSFERLDTGSPWFGYRQFCEQFLNPLLLQSRGIPFQPWLRGNPRGITPGECRAALPLRTRARPSVFTHVGLHAWAEKRYASSQRDVRGELKAAGFSPTIVRAQLRRLRKVVNRLRWKQSESTWSEYTERGHYTDADLQAKDDFVRRISAARHRRQVVDVGANDGRFSEIALESADYAVALDADVLTVDHLYRRLRDAGERRILPLTMDAASLAVPAGWRGRERPAFVDRVQPDLVLMLAVVHHLAISDMVPLDEVVKMLADFGAESIVEMPTPDDPMVKRLSSAKKAGVVDRYTIDTFESAVVTAFDIVEQQTLPSGTRNIYHLRPRT